MDANATFQRMLEALNKKDYQLANESANRLMKWLRCDGEPPEVTVAVGGAGVSLQQRQSRRDAAIAVATS